MTTTKRLLLAALTIPTAWCVGQLYADAALTWPLFTLAVALNEETIKRMAADVVPAWMVGLTFGILETLLYLVLGALHGYSAGFLVSVAFLRCFTAIPFHVSVARLYAYGWVGFAFAVVAHLWWNTLLLAVDHVAFFQATAGFWKLLMIYAAVLPLTTYAQRPDRTRITVPL